MRSDSAPELVVEDLSVEFGHGRQRRRVLDRLSFSLAAGRTLGVVGESGSGKSTLAKALVGIVPTATGKAIIAGEPVGEGRKARPQLVQLIPQDPYSSLDPRRSVGQAIVEAIDPSRQSVGRHREAVRTALAEVQLDPDALDRKPHEFSGGQRQRVAIARALAAAPRLLIADEITSALDVSVQAQVLQLLRRIREERQLTMLFISHDLAVVSQLSDEVLVIRDGGIVEHAPAATIFREPQHEYTEQLLRSIPGSPGLRLHTAERTAGRLENAQ